MRDHFRMKQALHMLPEAYSGTTQGYQSLKYCNYRGESLGQIDTTSEKISYWRIFWKSFMSASLICCCVGCDWHGSNRAWQSNWFFWTQSVGPVENISLASDYLYSGNYRTKKKKIQSGFTTVLSSHWLLVPAEALLVFETYHRVVLVFFLFFFVISLFLPCVPNLLTCLLPHLLLLLFFSCLNDLSPLCLSSFPFLALTLTTGPPAAVAVVSAMSVTLRPAGVGGRLAFVAVQERGHDDQNGPQEEHTVDERR